MVSDPDTNLNKPQGASTPDAPPLVSGFASAAADDSSSGAEKKEARESYLKELWKRMKAPDQETPFFASNGQHPFSSQVLNSGDFLRMKATKLRPVTDKQIERLIKDAIEKNNWDKVFMFDHKGNADLDMARRVQGVIKQMRAAGRIDPECTISAAMDIRSIRGAGRLTGFIKL